MAFYHEAAYKRAIKLTDFLLYHWFIGLLTD